MRWLLAIALLAVANVAWGQTPRWDVTITGATGNFAAFDGLTYRVPHKVHSFWAVGGSNGPVGVSVVSYSPTTPYSEVSLFVTLPGGFTSPAGVNYSRSVMGQARVTPAAMSFTGACPDTGNGAFTAQAVFVP